MTTITQLQLVAPQQLTNADASLYTVPTSSAAKVGRAVFTNTSASSVTITAGITPGVALTASTTMIITQTITAYQTYLAPELTGAVIPAGSQLRAYASAASAVTVTVSGQLIQ